MKMPYRFVYRPNVGFHFLNMIPAPEIGLGLCQVDKTKPRPVPGVRADITSSTGPEEVGAHPWQKPAAPVFLLGSCPWSGCWSAWRCQECLRQAAAAVVGQLGEPGSRLRQHQSPHL